MLIPTPDENMTAVIGPDFIALQVKDLRRSQSFYTDQLGLRAASFSPPGAVVFDTRPVPFAVREPLVDLSASPRLGWGVSLWLAADDAQGLHDRLLAAGIPILQPPSRGPFGLQFSFSDPDGYTITIHQSKP
jgi:catechol 2,3-dioxygenase-like lactoylglutathione lyase family enzyme